jgi:hypothetical protein
LPDECQKEETICSYISVIVIVAGALYAILKPPDPAPITTTTTTSTTTPVTTPVDKTAVAASDDVPIAAYDDVFTTATPKTTQYVLETTPHHTTTTMTAVGPNEPQTVEGIIEANVLSRGNKFSELSLQDSRSLALDWLLNKDLMKVTSTDFNLSQRYILALLAFEFGIMFQSTRNWLSNENECSWDGITCDEGQEVSEIVLGASWVNMQQVSLSLITI